MQVVHQQGLRGRRGRRLGLLAAVALCAVATAFAVTMPSLAKAASRYTPVQAVVPVSVNVTGDKPSADETFTFEIAGADGETVLPQEKRVTVTGSGAASFTMSYDEVGEHHYTVRQVAGSAERWTYDSQVYDVTVYCMWEETTDSLFTKVIVKDASGYKADGCTFENAYTAPVVPQEPSEPSQPAKPAGKTPFTGDLTNYGPAIALACVGVALVGVAVWHFRRTRTNE